MHRIVPVLLFAILGLAVIAPNCRGQGATEDSARTEVPRAEYIPRLASSVAPTFSAGFGVPYGVIGGRVGLAVGPASLDFGGGIVPLAWEPAGSIGASLYFTDRLTTVRPKATVVLSNVVGFVVLMEEGSLDPLFSKTYPGIAVYGGVDWRSAKKSALCVDVNLGAVFPFDGIDQMKRDLDAVLEEYRARGFLIEDVKKPRAFPMISIGVVYAPGRALKKNQAEE